MDQWSPLTRQNSICNHISPRHTNHLKHSQNIPSSSTFFHQMQRSHPQPSSHCSPPTQKPQRHTSTSQHQQHQYRQWLPTLQHPNIQNMHSHNTQQDVHILNEQQNIRHQTHTYMQLPQCHLSHHMHKM